MILMVHDYETTGLPIWREIPSDDPTQPHIVQAAVALFDVGTRRMLNHFACYVQPEGFDAMPDEALATHGLTMDFLRLHGIPRMDFVRQFWSLWALADHRLAHNKAMEDRMIRITLKRLESEGRLKGALERAEEYKAAGSYCTQARSTPHVNEQRKRDGQKAKTASLQEAYEHIIGRPLPMPHHDAWRDMLSTAELWFALDDLEGGSPSGIPPNAPAPRMEALDRAPTPSTEAADNAKKLGGLWS